MSDNVKNSVLLVGAGGMAQEYAKVLYALELPLTVVGRGQRSADSFESARNIKVHQGGLSSFFQKNGSARFDHAIVAVGVDQLAAATLQLLDRGIRNILVEKPAGLNSGEVLTVAAGASRAGAHIAVAYNRRFYSSVLKAKELIAQDGGVTSFQFEFTEWPHVIEGLDVPVAVKHHWFLANSTHVVDMAFHMGGKPREITCFSSGGSGWHPAASIFSGAGVSTQGALFSYQANWGAPGRWGIEVLTNRRRFIFRPLEKLQVQKTGSVAVEFLDIDDALDRDYKPGLFRQVQAFVLGAKGNLCSIQEQADMMDVYYKMSNYPLVG